MWKRIVLCCQWALPKPNCSYFKFVRSVQRWPNSIESNGNWYCKMQVQSMCSKCVPHDVTQAKTTEGSDGRVKKGENLKPFKLPADFLKILTPGVPVKMDMSDHVSSSQKLANLNETEQKILKMIKMEFEVMRSTHYKVPVEVNDDDWVMLLQCKSYKERLKYINGKFDELMKDYIILSKQMKRNRYKTAETRVTVTHSADDHSKERTTYERNVLLARRSRIAAVTNTFQNIYYQNKSRIEKQNPINVLLDINSDTTWDELQRVVWKNYTFDEACNITFCNTTKDRYWREIETSAWSTLAKSWQWRRESFYKIFNDHKKIIYISNSTKYMRRFKFDPSVVYVIGNRNKDDIQRDVNLTNVDVIKPPISDFITEKFQEIAQQRSREEAEILKEEFKRNEKMEDYIIILKLLRRGYDWRRITDHLYQHDIERILGRIKRR